jgi:hypothetical protein
MAVVSVALPVKLGALSLVHFDDVAPPEQLESLIVPKLRKTAGEIAKALLLDSRPEVQ